MNSRQRRKAAKSKRPSRTALGAIWTRWDGHIRTKLGPNAHYYGSTHFEEWLATQHHCVINTLHTYVLDGDCGIPDAYIESIEKEADARLDAILLGKALKS
jgi:hypothetical protein